MGKIVISSSFGLPDAHATMALHLFAMTSAYTLGGHMMPSSAIATRSPTSAVTMFDEGFLRDNAALEKINSVAFDEGLRAPGRAALEALDALMPSVESVDDLSVEDRGDRYIVSLSAPYVEPEDLEVEVEDGFLTVPARRTMSSGPVVARLHILSVRFDCPLTLMPKSTASLMWART